MPLTNLGPGAVTQHKIDRSRSKWDRLIEFQLAATNSYTQEGETMVQKAETGTDYIVADRSAGSANEQFIGCAISDFRRVSDFVKTENVVVPSVSAFAVQLKKTTPVAGTFFVQDSTGTVMTNTSPSAPTATNEYAVSTGGLITFHSSRAGQTMFVRYTYLPTTAELNALFYQRPQAAQGQSLIQQVPVAQGNCEIYTTAYNTANTYTIGARVYTGASGKFTTSSTAVQVAGVVVSVPSTTDVYLGVAYNVTVPGTLTW